MRLIVRSLVMVGLSVAGWTVSGGIALAEDVRKIEEVVVVARSVGESLDTVPVAVSSLSGDDMQRYATSDLVALSQQVPQLELHQGAAGSGASFMIRGVGTTGDDAGLSQAVSLNIDGVQVQRSRFLYNTMFDIDQVSILKGPQALFFGKNSPAGVISVESADPGDSFEGYFMTGHELEAEETWVEGAIGGAITDRLRVRLAGRYSDMREGWVENISEPRPDPNIPSVTLPGAHERWGPKAERAAGRLTVLFDPTDTFSSKLKVNYGSYEDAGTLSTAETVCVGQPMSLTSSFTFEPDPRSDCDLDGQKAATAVPPLYLEGSHDRRWARTGEPYSDIESLLVTWTNEWELSKFNIRATTGYSELEGAGKDNYTVMEFASFLGGYKEDFDSFSQEIRLVSMFDGPWNFTLGGYYEESDNTQDYDLVLVNFGPDPVTGSYITSIKSSTADFTTVSAFAQLRYDILPNLELAVGARWTEEERDTWQSNTVTHSLAGLLGVSPAGRIIDTRFKDDDVSPEVTLTWYPDDNSSLYAAFKTGYKSGGTAVPSLLTAGNTAENLRFESETVEGGEIGYKVRAFDDRMRLNLTAYYYEFKDLQLASWDPESLSFAIQNAADSEQKGIEGNVEFIVTDELELNASFGYNDLKFKDFKNAACYAFQTPEQGCRPIDPANPALGSVQDLSGKRLHRAPKFAANFGFAYQTALSPDWLVQLTSHVSYTGKSISGETQNPLTKQDAYWLYNASARLMSADQRWELALIGVNLGDERYNGFVQDTAGGAPGMVTILGSRGREVSLQFSYRFD